DLTPLPVKDWATSTFGTEDKTVLLLGVFVLLFGFAVVIGILAMRRLSLGLAGLCLVAVIGLVAALTRHGASAAYAPPTVVGAAGGLFGVYRLVRWARWACPSAAAADPLPPIVFDSAAEGASGSPGSPGSPDGPSPDGELRAPELPGSNVPALRLPQPRSADA